MCRIAWLLTLLLLPVPSGLAQDEAKEKPVADEAVPKAESAVTRHQVEIAGDVIRYEATAGTLILRNDKDQPVASFGYTAYTKEGVSDPGRRPITFAYNGGPGSSSIWLHMGALGPRRAVASDAGFTPPPPYRLIENEHSILDRTDLVMIDPVGTGYSKPVGEAKPEDFWGVDEDIRSVSEFIKQYVSENGRWRSPKYLLGESYGGMRSGGVVYHLQKVHSMGFNGVILVSPFLDAIPAMDGFGSDLPHVLVLPTLAATAWYHDALRDKPSDLRAFLDEVERFAVDEYSPALMKGRQLGAAERAAVLRKLSGYTGVDEGYWDRANLRVSHRQFTKELLRDRKQTAGRIDSRFVGVSFDLLAEEMSYDPMLASISSAFTAAFLDYYHNALEFGRDKSYAVTAFGIGSKWKWNHKRPDLDFPFPIPSTAPDLAHAMGENPSLEVLILQGYYDLATPHFVTEYVIDHMDLQPTQADNITIEYFEAGHMMYLHEPSLKKFRQNIIAFIDRTDRL